MARLPAKPVMAINATSNANIAKARVQGNQTRRNAMAARLALSANEAGAMGGEAAPAAL
ncbi:hypothetical protein [Paucibacter sp. KBW04]|uniref:hypothetical protein n=1 Tax=Paucibacter sp. KBW04 TaxID=2153361 RepID=UPI0012DCC861|nr:hypothetical protein [Paucibacter sp. KBW04]